MTFETAVRLIEIGLALALLQRAAEHLRTDAQALYLLQGLFCCALLTGLVSPYAALGLWSLAVAQLHIFEGPYNGGSDKMAFLALTCLTLAHWLPVTVWSELALAYLAVQIVLSYWVSGWVKLNNVAWRNGAALRDVFALSAYPQAERFRRFANKPRALRLGSWAVIGFEVLFPLAVVALPLLYAALAAAALFHLANAILFGLNRFLWIWISTYPALIWFQGRIFG